MSIVLDEDPVGHEATLALECAANDQARPSGDTLAASVIILLVMTVAQRLIGFGRGMLFCRWLGPEELGQWDVAFGFLNLAAPLAVLGLPGSFGRYVEYFRQRGQFHTFLRRTTVVSLIMCFVATVSMIVFRDRFSYLIFGTSNSGHLVFWVALCLAVVTVHNFLTSLFIAVRRYRIVTVLQFVQSLGFAVISLTLLAIWPLGAASVIIGYAVATVLSGVGSLACLRDLTTSEPPSTEPAPHAAFWAKLMPFAMWMWATNLLSNLFEVIDRYMILHHSGMEVNEALRQVGVYHSSRIIPLLFVAVIGLLGTLITPHLSHDWEQGRREAVVRRLNMVLKLLYGSLVAASIAVLFVAPLMFNVAFRHKFEGAMGVLPWTLAYCCWFGSLAVAHNYLFCAERPGLAALPLLIGLLVNIGCNLYLLPRYGLEGAAWSTTIANVVALTLTYFFSQAMGMRIDAGTWITATLPCSLCFGPWWALAAFSVVCVLAVTTDRLLTRDEKQEIITGIGRGMERTRQVSNRLLRRGSNAATT